MNVLEKLAQVQQKLAVPKANKNSFANYNYRNVEDIEKAVKPLLAEVKASIVLTDQVVEVGGRVYVKATAKFLDLEKFDDEGKVIFLDATAYAREAVDKKGMDDSQLTGATSSYARKFALGGLLLIDNEKDSDSTNTHGKEPAKASTTATSPIKRAILLEYAEDTDIVNHKKWLLHNVWIRFGWDDSKSLMRNLEAMPMAWSIDRALRELRVEGKIKLAKDIEEERFKQYKAETERRSGKVSSGWEDPLGWLNKYKR